MHSRSTCLLIIFMVTSRYLSSFFFFFNDTATTEIYTLSLHDALPIFLQALQLCQQAGMVRLGKVALDGAKLRGNASRHKALSYKRVVEREKQLEAEIDAMLAEAERQDAVEDERLGPDGRGEHLPEGLKP